MASKLAKIAGITLTTALLFGGFTQAQASGELPILKACLAKAAEAANPEAAKSQCMWEHWDLMAESG